VAELEDSLQPGAERYEYDSAGRIARIEYPGGEALELAHDLRDRRSAATYRSPQGALLREIRYGYDAANRLSSLDDDDRTLLTRIYREGRPHQTVTANGLVRTLDYDAATGLPAGATTTHPLLGTVEETVVTRRVDPVSGELEVVADSQTLGALTTGTREEFALSATGSPGAAGARLSGFYDGAVARSYAYDALSNLTASGDGRSHAYNPERNRLLRIEDGGAGSMPIDYQYDAAGYVTRRGGVPIDWTALGFVRSIGDRASFEWDMQGRPLRRTVDGWETRFLFGGSVEADATGAPLRLVIDEVEIPLDSEGHRYRHLDFRGNVKLVSDDFGNLVAHYAYGPYGVDERFGDSDGAATFAQGLDLTDLFVIGNRLHDAIAARALSPDPILQLTNQYAYAHGNPVTFWDPSGLDPRVSPALAAAETDLAIASARILVGSGIAVIGGIATLQSPPVGLSIIVLGTGLVIDGTFEYIRAQRHGEIVREQGEDDGSGSAGPSHPTSSSFDVSPGIFGGPPPFIRFESSEEGGWTNPSGAAELAGSRLGFGLSFGFGGFGGF
jgi:RHS repeat-associated protein